MHVNSVILYLDPGSGSMLVQVVVGGAAAVAVGGKLFFRRIMEVLHLRKREPRPDEPVE
jgi:hypothetical protein